MLQQPCTRGQRCAGHHRQQILDQEGHAAQGAVGQVPLRRLARLVEHGVDDGVDLRVARLDAGNGGLDQFQRRHLPGAHQFGQAERVVVFDIRQRRP
jgi:hypothetical protein